jgi:hypothetical protein
MCVMIRSLAMLVVLLPAMATAQSTVPASSLDTRGIWSDWRRLNAASLDAEARRSESPARTVTAARSLGERVGELVAAGDCEGGERMAREAGDFPLIEAVRDYCRTRIRR